MSTNTASRLTECYRALDAIGVDFTPENVEKLRALSEDYYPWNMTETAESVTNETDWEDWQRCEGIEGLWDVVADELHCEIWETIYKTHGTLGAAVFVKGYGLTEREAIVKELDDTYRGNGWGPLVIETDTAGIGTYYARKA